MCLGLVRIPLPPLGYKRRNPHMILFEREGGRICMIIFDIRELRMKAKFECLNPDCKLYFKEQDLECESLKLPGCVECKDSLQLVPEDAGFKINTRGCSSASNPFSH